jgi:hypothetical protein
MKLDASTIACIADFCKKWSITEFALFGSILREDFRPDSDVDVCVVFDPSKRFDFDEYLEMLDELSKIFGGRKVDLIERRLIKNPFRRHAIITTRKIVYAA